MVTLIFWRVVTRCDDQPTGSLCDPRSPWCDFPFTSNCDTWILILSEQEGFRFDFNLRKSRILLLLEQTDGFHTVLYRTGLRAMGTNLKRDEQTSERVLTSQKGFLLFQSLITGLRQPTTNPAYSK